MTVVLLGATLSVVGMRGSRDEAYISCRHSNVHDHSWGVYHDHQSNMATQKQLTLTLSVFTLRSFIKGGAMELQLATLVCYNKMELVSLGHREFLTLLLILLLRDLNHSLMGHTSIRCALWHHENTKLIFYLLVLCSSSYGSLYGR